MNRRFFSAHKSLSGLSAEMLGALSSGQTLAGQNDLYDLYARSSTIYACANLRAENVAQVVFRAVDAAGSPIPHPVNAVFADTSNIRDVLRRIELSLFFNRQGALIVPRPNIFGRFLAGSDNLFCLHPRVWSLRYGGDGLEGYQITLASGIYDRDGSAAHFIERDDAMHLNLFGFASDFAGVPPVEAAWLAADAMAEKAETIKSHFENRAVPANIIQPAADNVSLAGRRDAAEQLAEKLRLLFKGARGAGRTLVQPDRVELITVPSDFAELKFGELSADARQAIAEAAQIPIELLTFTASSYAQAREAVRFWRESWLVPHVEWLAENFSRFFSAWYAEPVRVAADVSKLLREDETDRINAQVAAGYRDLYSAAQHAGITNPDERLRDLYMVSGVPTPVDRLGETRDLFLPTGFSGMTRPRSEDLPADADEMFSEIKKWQQVASRKGRDYPFVTRAIPAATAEWVRRDLAGSLPLDVVFDRARRSLKRAETLNIQKQETLSAAEDAEMFAQLVEVWVRLGLRELASSVFDDDEDEQTGNDSETQTKAAAKAPGILQRARRLFDRIRGQISRPVTVEQFIDRQRPAEDIREGSDPRPADDIREGSDLRRREGEPLSHQQREGGVPKPVELRDSAETRGWLEKYRSYFDQRVRQLAEDLASGRMDVTTWRNAMAQEIGNLHMTSAAAAAGGADNLTMNDARDTADRIRRQLVYLDRWADELRKTPTDVQLNPDAIAARGHLYGGARNATYELQRQRALGIPPLPAQPGEATQCRTNCGCSWRIVYLGTPGDYDCYWVRSKDDSCDTCLTRERVWYPLQIRGGVVVSDISTAGLFV